MAKKRRFTLTLLLARLLSSAFLVFATYNPTGYSYLHWAIDGDGPLALKVLIGLALGLLYGALIRVVVAAFRSSGLIVGSVAALLFSIETIVLLLPQNVTIAWHGSLQLAQYAILLAAALVIGFGTSWSYAIERLTGQQQKRYMQ